MRGKLTNVDPNPKITPAVTQYKPKTKMIITKANRRPEYIVKSI